jgi:hypothetical protein
MQQVGPVRPLRCAGNEGTFLEGAATRTCQVSLFDLSQQLAGSWRSMALTPGGNWTALLGEDWTCAANDWK